MTLNATEANCLKELLASWELDDLFHLLKDEEISVKVLKIMKRHHLKELLKNQKLGIRIRFEHQFEQWRQLLRMPLEEPQQPTELQQTQQAPVTKAIKNSTAIKSAPVPLTTVASRSFISIAKRQTLDEETLLAKPNMSITEEVKATGDVDTELMKYQHVNSEKQSKDSGITVLKILRESGSKGDSLLQAYEEEQTFTPLQRQLLISLIVAYFEMKNYHLSLGTSQILENQIIDLFPTEQVECYRGKKKSKIYMKYSNAKRRDTDFFPSKKRARPAQSNNEAEVEAENSNSDIEILPDKQSRLSKANGGGDAANSSNEQSGIDEQLNAYLIKSEYYSD